jgi:hypothetical protein
MAIEHVVGDVQELQRLCLDVHKVVVSLHGILDPLALHQFCKKIHLNYLTEVSEEAYWRLMAKYGDVSQQIQERLDSDLNDVVDDEERDRQEKKQYLFKIYQQLERRSHIVGDVQELHRLCLDAHEVVVSLHSAVDPLALHQPCKKIHFHSVDVIVDQS